MRQRCQHFLVVLKKWTHQPGLRSGSFGIVDELTPDAEHTLINLHNACTMSTSIPPALSQLNPRFLVRGRSTKRPLKSFNKLQANSLKKINSSGSAIDVHTKKSMMVYFLK